MNYTVDRRGTVDSLDGLNVDEAMAIICQRLAERRQEELNAAEAEASAEFEE